MPVSPMSRLSAENLSAIAARMQDIWPVAREAASLLKEMQNGVLDIRTKSSQIDLVTSADLKSEDILLGFIKNKYPDDGILAEESGGKMPEQGFCWVIDPLDGTVNYAHGLPLYCVAIGLMLDYIPVAGIVIHPELSHEYSAVLGAGAFKDGKMIQVSEIEELNKAIVVTGFPYNRKEMMTSLVRGVEIVLSNAGGIRRTGSAALDLCWLAEGRFDVFYEFQLGPWDTCAAALIASEAGALVTDFRGAPHHPSIREIVASNGILHDRVLELLEEISPNH